MEQNLAILIADLSGYTALTETHGASTAAETVERFIEMVQESLTGKSSLHQRIGDEVMIVSESADDLMQTAFLIAEKCSKENYFLQIHGALHYGKVLKQNDQYYGSPVNITSRITGDADKGTFCCSADFINALQDPDEVLFVSKGEQVFKNLSAAIHVFEILMIDKAVPVYLDPVCRMLIHDVENAIQHPDNSGIFFCSAHCLEIALTSHLHHQHLIAF